MLEQAGFSITKRESDIPLSKQEIIDGCKAHNALFCTLSDPIDAELIEACKHLDIISQFAVGYDNIDIATANKNKIPVGYTPGVLSEATADIAFVLMLATARKMLFLHKKILQKEWKTFSPTANLGIELQGKTLGIFGLGRIGMVMAQRCRDAYGMNILYHNRSKNQHAEERFKATYVDFETLLKESDVVSVHASLNDSTKEIFDQRAFAMMKPSAIFINTARGGLHQEDDLIKALQQKQIWGAGLDVTNPEPMQPNNPLLEMDSVTILPHVGSGTEETRGNMSALAAQNIISYFQEGIVPHIVNPEVLKK